MTNKPAEVTREHRCSAILALTGWSFSVTDHDAGERWVASDELPDDHEHPDYEDLLMADSVAQAIADAEERGRREGRGDAIQWRKLLQCSKARFSALACHKPKEIKEWLNTPDYRDLLAGLRTALETKP